MENQNENPVETEEEGQISQNQQIQEVEQKNENKEVISKLQVKEVKNVKQRDDNLSKSEQQVINNSGEYENQQENEQQLQNPVLIENENLNIQEYLERQLERYRKIEAQCVLQKDKGVLKRIMSTLEGQLEKLKFNVIEPITNDVSNFGGISLIKELEQTEESFFSKSKIQSHLKEIYKFYSKIFYVRGPSDDFTRINHESQTLTEGKFIIFCRQFGLLDEKIHHIRTQSKYVETNRILNDTVSNKINKIIPASTRNHQQKNMKILSFKELNLLFRRVNQNQNEITFMNFIILLRELSKFMFLEDQAKAEIKLFRYMEVDSTQFKKKMKSLNTPFESKDEQGFRKPKGLQMQRFINYSTDQLKSRKILVEEWKNVKKQELRDKIIQQIDQSRSKSIIFEPSYIKTNNYRERMLKKIGLFEKSYQIINWEKLDKLDPKFLLHEEFKPEDLIEENDNEDDNYLKSYDLSKQNNESGKKISSLDQRSSKYQLKTESTKKRQIQNISKLSQQFDKESAYLKLPRLQNK